MGVCYPSFRVTSPSGGVFFIEKGEKMHESRPIIALDFPSFDDVKSFLALFPADETFMSRLVWNFIMLKDQRLSAMSNL